MKTKVILMLAITALATSSCARMTFYKTPDLSGEETGIKFYTPKPYLLVARTGNKDKPVEVQIIYLPDLSDARYAKPTAGYGSADISVTLSNGMLTNFGSKTDATIPALMTALGGFDQAIATASKIRKETDLLHPQAGVNYTDYGTSLINVATDLRTAMGKAQGQILTRNEKESGEKIAKNIEESGQLLKGPGGEQNLLSVLTNLRSASKTWGENIATSPASAVDGKFIRDQLDRLKSELDRIIKAITPKKEPESAFALYEIDNSKAGQTKLIEIKFE